MGNVLLSAISDVALTTTLPQLFCKSKIEMITNASICVKGPIIRLELFGFDSICGKSYLIKDNAIGIVMFINIIIVIVIISCDTLSQHSSIVVDVNSLL